MKDKSVIEWLTTGSVVIFAMVLGIVSILFNNGSAFATCTTDSTTGDVTCTESATATVHVAEACTMTATVNTPHIADITNGLYSGGIAEYANGIGKTTLKVICNDASGFSIYAVGYTNNEFGNTKLMTNTADSSAPIINTDTYNSGDTSAWSMKINAVSGTYAPTLDNSFGSYHNVPSTYTRVAYRTSGTDVANGATEATGSSVEATYAAYISPTQPAGTYSGQVKYTLVHPANTRPAEPQVTQAGKICYYANATDAVGTMGCQTVSTTATSATLLAGNFSRSGYGFAGWSNKFDYATNPNQEGIKFYGPNETITFTAGQYSGTNNGLSLYAVWVKSAGNLQDSTKVAELCGTGADALTQAPTDGTANLSSVSALIDQRDNQTYAIAKLADGKCWMIENLRLDNSATLTITNTNKPLNDGANVTLKHSYSDTETYNTLSASQGPTTTAWCTTITASCNDQSMLFTGNTTNRASNPTTNSGSMYSYGNYYNWYSATAGRGTYNFSTNNNSVAGDLCPAGWRLPKGGDKTRIESNDDNEFWNLTVDALNGGVTPANYSSSTAPYYTGTTEAGPVDKKLRSYPNNYLYSGYVSGGSLVNRGSYGGFWSSTAYSTNSAYNLLLGRSDVGPGSVSNYKYIGSTVRCIAGS